MSFVPATPDNIEEALMDMDVNSTNISCGVKQLHGFELLRYWKDEDLPEDGFRFKPEDANKIWSYIWKRYLAPGDAPGLMASGNAATTVLFSDNLERDPYTAHKFVKWLRKNKSRWVRIIASPVTVNPNSGNRIRSYMLIYKATIR